MNNIISAQKNVLAEPVEYSWGQSSKGNEQCSVSFKLLEGPDEGKEITAYFYFTQETNAKRSVESLKYCGCTHPEGDIMNMDGFGGAQVRLVIEHDTYEGDTKARVKWVNSSKPYAESMDDGMQASFRDRMRGLVAKANKEQSSNDPWG